MVDFVEQATLKVRDQSSAPLNKINKAVTALLGSAKKLNGLKVEINGISRTMRQVNQLNGVIKGIPKSKTINLKATVTGAAGIQKQLANLTRMRTIQIRANLTGGNQRTRLPGGNSPGGNGRPPGAPPRIPAPPAVPPSAGANFARSFLNALRPVNAGASIARGFLGAIGGNIQGAVSKATGVALRAPLNKEDAVQLLNAAGLSPQTVQFMQGTASVLSGQFRGTTEASLLQSGREAAGRIPNIDTAEGQKQLTLVLTRVAQNTQILAAMTGQGITAGADQARIIEGAISQVGVTGDNKDAELISTAILRGIQASGGDLTAQDAKRTLQQLGIARNGVSGDTLTQLLLARDEQGARGTGEFRQIFEDLTRNTLLKSAKAAQIENGLRDKSGKSTVADAFRLNFLDAVKNEIIPRLTKAGVDTTDRVGVISGLSDLGFVKSGGIATLAEVVTNQAQMQQEFQRAQIAKPETFINSPTTRQRGEAVNAQFQNLADNALGGALPVVSTGLDLLAKSLANFNNGEAGLKDIAGVGAGAVTAGIGSSVLAIAQADAVTRPLALAGLGLNTSAAALTAAAAALSTAAGVQAGGAVLGGASSIAAGGGVMAMLRGFLSRAAIPVAAGAATAVALDLVDPKGNLGGATTGIDTAVKNATGIDPSNTSIGQITEAIKAGFAGPDAATASGIIAKASAAQDLAAKDAVTNSLAKILGQQASTKDGALGDVGSLTTAMQAAPTELTTAFATGNAGLATETVALTGVAAQFGPLAAAALLAAAPQLGQVAGAAIAAAIQGVTVNVNATTTQASEPKLDTGSQVLQF
jgi:hypothetical protein